MTPAQLSYGGLGLAAAVLLLTAVRWWRRGREVPGAAALAGGLLIGLLAALCTGGLLGFAARYLTTEATNPLGNKIAGGAETLLPQAGPAGLTAGGGVATTLLSIAVVLAWRCCDHQLRRQLTAGIVSGSALGLAGGISGLAATTLVPAANHVGDQILAALH
ncbi:hypothetical protein [Kitasatospora sp. MBT66]|uniref:hypothetical protein n=1 Tax=Kitasatospora sp. MBT66 TaxID=1444769 RepID=UPI0005B7F623|nr:hypothetical protein [Kitasatospora sp. MBT66]